MQINCLLQKNWSSLSGKFSENRCRNWLGIDTSAFFLNIFDYLGNDLVICKCKIEAHTITASLVALYKHFNLIFATFWVLPLLGNNFGGECADFRRHVLKEFNMSIALLYDFKECFLNYSKTIFFLRYSQLYIYHITEMFSIISSIAWNEKFLWFSNYFDFITILRIIAALFHEFFRLIISISKFLSKEISSLSIENFFFYSEWKIFWEIFNTTAWLR